MRLNRLHAFDNFRAIAIVLIVMGHSYGPWVIDTFPEKFVASFITGGTTLFVFISGFFFHNTFYPRFSWGPFLRTKLINIGVPYLILTAVYCAIFAMMFGGAPITDFQRGVSRGLLDYANIYLQYAFTGRATSAYWYVPFILLIFAASPLFVRFVKLRLHAQLVVFGTALLVSLLVHRPEHNDNPLHSVLYFTSVYLLGILTSKYKAEVFAFVQSHSVGLTVTVFLATLLKVLVDGDHKNHHKSEIFAFAGFDLVILVKCLQVALMLSLLLRFADRRVPVLHYVAERSFAIFFLHGFFTLALDASGPWLKSSSLPGLFIFLIASTLAFLGSIVAANVIRWVLQGRSRFVIGY